jgi:hypothetical protein
VTEQQAKMLHALRGTQATTAQLAQRLGMSLDQARNCAARMEKKGWLTGMGQGQGRKWSVTRPGQDAFAELGRDLVADASRSQSQGGATQQVLNDAGDGLRDETEEEKERREAGGSPTRTYVVLEQGSLRDAIEQHLPSDAVGVDDQGVLEVILEELEGIEVYFKVATPLSRNTEHAFRQAAKEVYADSEVDEPVLVAVAAKMFQPTPVEVNNSQTVRVGSPRSLATA